MKLKKYLGMARVASLAVFAVELLCVLSVSSGLRQCSGCTLRRRPSYLLSAQAPPGDMCRREQRARAGSLE